MKEKAAALLAAVILILASAPPAQATIIDQYPQPTAAYTSATYLIAITTALNADASAWSDGTVTVSSSSALNRRTAPSGPGGWATWDEAPESERTTGNTIPILYARSLPFIDLNFNLPLFLFGVELEPDALAPMTMTLEFFSGASSLGVITRSVDGDAGSRLFAGVTDAAFDRARVSITDGTGFALAQMRYSQTQPGDFAPVPEPSPALMLAAGCVIVLLLRFFLGFRSR